MKSAKFLIALSIFSCICLSVYAQADSTVYKLKIEQYQAWQKTGKILAISGAGVAGVGAGLRIYATTYYDKGKSDDAIVGASYAIMGIGVAAMINGLIFNGIGKRKTREYRIKLDDLRTQFYYTPEHSGIMLTYRF
ncbi:MAG: hypothetical protein MUC31_07670 [Bacteroidales bacterium]|nr:hypothetical protein [Bacteroidales bacterium]